jgi:PAP2 superfamily
MADEVGAMQCRCVVPPWAHRAEARLAVISHKATLHPNAAQRFRPWVKLLACVPVALYILLYASSGGIVGSLGPRGQLPPIDTESLPAAESWLLGLDDWRKASGFPRNVDDRDTWWNVTIDLITAFIYALHFMLALGAPPCFYLYAAGWHLRSVWLPWIFPAHAKMGTQHLRGSSQSSRSTSFSDPTTLGGSASLSDCERSFSSSSDENSLTRIGPASRSLSSSNRSSSSDSFENDRSTSVGGGGRSSSSTSISSTISSVLSSSSGLSSSSVSFEPSSGRDESAASDLEKSDSNTSLDESLLSVAGDDDSTSTSSDESQIIQLGNHSTEDDNNTETKVSCGSGSRTNSNLDADDHHDFKLASLACAENVRTTHSGIPDPQPWQYLFAFGLVGVSAVITQLSWPTAPPWWYFKFPNATEGTYNTTGDEAELENADDALNIQFYKSIWGGGTIVFGAWPSLHIGFPAIIALNMPGRRNQILMWLYVTLVIFSSMSLKHHFFVDALGGVIYALMAHLATIGCMKALFRKFPPEKLLAESQQLRNQYLPRPRRKRRRGCPHCCC